MTELLEAVVSWQNLLLVLLVFGFAPGFVLRLLVRLYPKDDPRRTVLIADLYDASRIERPLIVAEHLETALLEAVPYRVKAVLSFFRSKADKCNEEDDVAHDGEVSFWDGGAQTQCGKSLPAGTYKTPWFYGGSVTCPDCQSGKSGTGRILGPA